VAEIYSKIEKTVSILVHFRPQSQNGCYDRVSEVRRIIFFGLVLGVFFFLLVKLLLIKIFPRSSGQQSRRVRVQNAGIAMGRVAQDPGTLLDSVRLKSEAEEPVEHFSEF